jgi:hypothetical protein
MKHVEIDLHFMWERMAIGDVRVLHVPTTSQFADIFMKSLPTSLFSYPNLVHFASLTLTVEYWGSGWHMHPNKTITIT